MRCAITADLLRACKKGIIDAKQRCALNSLKGYIPILIRVEGLEGAVNLLQLLIAHHSRLQDGKAQKFFSVDKQSPTIGGLDSTTTETIEFYTLVIAAPFLSCFDCQDELRA